MKKTFILGCILCLVVISLLLILAAAGAAEAVTIDDNPATSNPNTVTFSGSQNNGGSLYAASASFTLSGQTLTIVFTNTSTQEVTDPKQMLATLFWYSPTINLSLQVAALTGGSSWVNPDGLTLNPGGG